MDLRLDALRHWLHSLPRALGLDVDTLRPASDDASFRRYFRLDARDPATLIVMDAPPPMEDVQPFLHAAEVFERSGVSVPRRFAADAGAGFVLLEDFGQVTYLDALDARTAPRLYAQASETLITLQSAGRPDAFPDYDRDRLAAELALFPQWYLARHRGVTLSDSEREGLDEVFGCLLDNALGQPRAQVHRDFHSRNLMCLQKDRGPGVLDFQDAVIGPITYDLVSLLKDAYIDWEEAQVLDWTIRHWERARKAGLPVPAAFGDFYRDFEWMGLQRHLKVLGIFARLHHRDGKSRYLADLPRVLAYARDTSRRYGALLPLARLFDRIEGDAPRTGLTF